ncbi:hypothetical protein HRTV5_71 [Halorubrum tailed phage 5]|uniref:Uncharacterized protein n=1 Tax=Halorubrum tailed phage 5 TaxID=2847107 RepID=R4T5W6_9CAUD|nr:hypothetical protein M194_gp056 [Halorubrum tailed phage 5]AGM11044.1 hypothetical protein HRTV5_71 [Halorubrum tailed phage 5]
MKPARVASLNTVPPVRARDVRASPRGAKNDHSHKWEITRSFYGKRARSGVPTWGRTLHGGRVPGLGYKSR